MNIHPKSIYKGLIEDSFATQIWLHSDASKVTTANSIINMVKLISCISVQWTWEECVYSTVAEKSVLYLKYVFIDF